MADWDALQFQLSLIQRELDEVEPLFQVLESRPPDLVEIRAMGSVIQTFYNGVESCLVLLSGMPKTNSNQFHQKVLENAQGVLSGSTVSSLDQYRRFRHKFRHSYGFTLTWDMMEPLVLQMKDVFQSFQKEILKAIPESPQPQ